MPHVVSQWQTEQYHQPGIDSPLTTKLQKATSTEYMRPVQISIRRSRRTGGLRPTPSLSVLAAREHEQWDYGSGETYNRASSEELWSSKSATESVFDMYADSHYESPNSSTHSSFIAELEDTAPVRTSKILRRSAPPSSNKQVYISPSGMEFKSTELSARAVIKVVDETIAAIEDSNRKLLCRAMAAEEAAKVLLEQNSQLQLEIKRHSRKLRPKTAPTSPVSRTRAKRSDATPLSVFNDTIDELILAPRPAKQRAQSEPIRPPPYPRRLESLLPATPLSAPPQRELMPSPFKDENFSTSPQQKAPPRGQYTSLSTRTHQPSQLHLQLPRLQTHTQPQTQLLPPFRSPGFSSSPHMLSPNTMPRYASRYQGAPLSCTTAFNASDARTEKPLPPLGPMSPSVLSGLVEIGTPNGRDEWGREVKILEDEVGGKRRRGFSELFKRGKMPVWK